MVEIEILIGLILFVVIVSALRGAHHNKIMRKLQLKQLEEMRKANHRSQTAIPERQYRGFWDWLNG